VFVAVVPSWLMVMRPVVCMITAPVLSAADEDGLIDRIAAAARAGVHLVQVRQPRLEGLAATRLVGRAVQAVAGTPARIVVNDRADVAIAAGAHGVHLRGDSMPATRVRAIAPPAFIIGRSIHTSTDAVAAERMGALDYLIFGTVFATRSKPGVAPAGVDRLAEVCAAVSLPVLAIGGVTAGTMAAVAGAGAAGFAAIGLFTDATIEAMPGTIARCVAAFDTPGALS
jgi:thiamine-phosphate pyrophosphorylase